MADPAIERVAETGSTNDDLLARVRAAAAAGQTSFAPCLRVAEHQTAGRGRQGRRWHARPGSSLTFSIAWPCARADSSGLSLAIGAALADALEPPSPMAPARIALKWPNDLWLRDDGAETTAVRGRKLAGVLVETAPIGRGRVAVIGVGINIGSHEVADAAVGVAGLDEIEAGAAATTTLARIAPALFAALRRFDEAGFAPFAERFAARDLLRGRRVAGSGAGGALAGIAVGIAADGALLIETDGGVVAVASGEWRLAALAAAESPC
jgi:BirA family transcriptional regulator, biotin operon repressor / biotin---[acetyl-CoA-carboxylase] ligase